MENKGFGCFGLVVFTVILAAIGAILNGWVLSVVWLWFVVPFGAPTLTIPQAIGISLVAALLTHQENKNDNDDDFTEAIIKAVIVAIASPLMTIGFAYIVKLFL